MKRTTGIGSSDLWLSLAWCLMLSLALLLAMLSACPGEVQGEEQDLPDTFCVMDWPYSAVAFVGKDHVDLKWQPYEKRPTYRILRDGEKIAEYGTGTRWHRDEGVSEGQVHTYQLCAIEEGKPDECTAETQVTVGRIYGELWRDTTWGSGQYRVWKTVGMCDGATLDIGSGAEVVEDDGAYYAFIDDEWGYIHAQSAHLGVPVYLRKAGSYVRDSTILPDGALHYRSWDGGTISGNTFQTSTLTIEHDTAALHTLTDNSFYASKITVGRGQVTPTKGKVHIHLNRFYDGSEIMMTGESEGIVEYNSFWDSSVTLISTQLVNVRTNHFRNHHPGPEALWVHATSPSIIEENVLDGFDEARLSDFHRAIFVRGHRPDLYPGLELTVQEVTIEGNVISGWSNGIDLWGDLEAVVRGNTITANQIGVYVETEEGKDPVATIYDNCIAGNGCTNNISCGGLTAAGRTTPLDAIGNFWGHASGPTHPNNPSGQGDDIDEGGTVGLVDYSGWLQSHGCTINDLSVGGVEVVQVVQELNNSVPLVAGKPAVVRVYVDSFLDTMSAPVELKGYRDGSLLGSTDGAATASPITDWDAVRSEPGLTFRLPEKWLSGTVSFTVEVNPQHTIAETTYDNNKWSKELTFVSKYPLNINYLPIKYAPGSSPGRLPEEQTLLQKHGLLEQVLPFRGIGLQILPPFEVDAEVEGDFFNTIFFIQSLIEIRAGLDRGLPRNVLGPLVAVFPEGSFSEDPWFRSAGAAPVGWGNESEAAFAAGQALGLRPPNVMGPCGYPEMPEGWPYLDATIQEYGYDHVMNQIVPRSHYDLAALCTPRWISPYHYGKIFVSDWGQWPSQAAVQAAPSVDQTYLLVRGLVYTDSTVTFSPSWQITSANPPDNYPADGFEYCLELRDAGDAVLADHCFNAEFLGETFGGEPDVAIFVAGLPLDPNSTKVVLRKGAVELGQVVASAHLPTVTLDTPNGGESPGDHVLVQWTAQDVDPGDELTYQLWYSHDDGATWLPVAVGLTDTDSFDFDLSWVPGGANARMRVAVSDGFYTASDESNGAFSVPRKAPWVLITHPEAGAVVTPPLTLDGIAYDLEEGGLDGAALAWTSDLDGQLGTGDTVQGVELSPGEHVLMLTATDGQGLRSSDTVTVSVGAITDEIYIYLPLVQRQP